jgi:acyl transferase domain-containing protein
MLFVQTIRLSPLLIHLVQALVGGTNSILGPDSFLSLTNMNFLSTDSLSYSFDERANGYSKGEGHCIVVLKRLSDAIRDGNTIRAVIRSTGSNQDGRTPGITQPSAEGQEALIRATYRKAGLTLSSTNYVEAHGTGTALGYGL